MGSALTASDTFGQAVEGFETARELNSYGSVISSIGAVGASAAANKIVGMPSGFSWRNVAVAGISSGLGNALQGNETVAGFIGKSGPLVGSTLMGVGQSAIRYGVEKALFNKGHWDFKNVALDAFGNAVANEMVATLSAPPSTGKVRV